MKILEIIKRRKVEAKSSSEQKTTLETKEETIQSKMDNTSRSTELFFDDSDLGYC